jgi:UDP-N-acetylmuramyl pentapeptide phosphotransferase/UDP-N-acetylglucosamine-1-phosphate transferase
MDNFSLFLIASGCLSLLLVGLIRHSLSTYLLDIPNHRSSHTQPTPRGGGLGFILAFAVVSIAMFLFRSQWIETSDLIKIWTVLLPLIAIGIVDDVRNIPANIRYLVQLSVAGLAVFHFGAFPQPWFSVLGEVGTITAIALTVIGMTALINFYNFMDGLDGLVAGVSAVQLTVLAIALNQPVLMVLVVALLGFLWWNWSPAKSFMGDVGSTALGATVAIALLNSSGDPLQAWSLLAVTLPLIGDAIYTLILRLMRRENIFLAHRTHLYQRLQQAGWSHAQVATSYMGLTAAVSAMVLIGGAIGAVFSLIAVISLLFLAERYLTHLKGEKLRTVLKDNWNLMAVDRLKSLL